MAGMTNDDIADVLERIADLLEIEGKDGFKVRAWRNASLTARETQEPLIEIVGRDGEPGLVKLPGIGKSIASAIHEYVTTGHLGFLSRLEAEVSPVALFTTIPGIGEDLAESIVETLHVRTLEELEVAAHDGRLADVPGFGERRVRGVREALAGRLGQAATRRAHERVRHEPTIEPPPIRLLLDIDSEYREKAEGDELHRIAPRRFNPNHEAWLPIWSPERGGYRFTVMFSNTAHAHELGKTSDWVVIYFERDGGEGQCTVVTETRGPLEGRRVVRGRESECAALED
ncbi:MAG: helix-hairpin-helix domain-containing protein [Planctomycetota bacterium]